MDLIRFGPSMADPRALRLTESPLGVRRAALRQFTVSLCANVREPSVAAIVILIASAQVTARSEDPNGASFYLVAGLVVLRGRETWIPALLAVAIANRDSAVFMPALILAKHSIDWRHLSKLRVRTPLVTAVAAWVIAAVVYLAIHVHYGP